VNDWRDRVRSARGQMMLFGLTFLGAVVLAVVAVCLRDVFFERFVREKYPPLAEGDRDRAGDLAAANVEPGKLEELLRDLGGAPLREAVYGAWIEEPDLDPQRRLARRLAVAQPDWLLERLARTLVAGNPQQRGRATQWLALLPDEQNHRARELARFARIRAERRREDNLIAEADAALETLSPPRDRP
jgi:hypothetical protein